MVLDLAWTGAVVVVVVLVVRSGGGSGSDGISCGS